MGHIIVTGAAGCVGSAVSNFLAEVGHDVTGIDLAAEAQGWSGRFFGGVDLTHAGDTARVAGRIGQSVDGLVNVAGGFRWETIAGGDPASWEFLYRINVMTAVNMTRALLPALLVTRGAIVNLGAAAALRAGAGMGAYTASKSGVARFTEALAEEVKGEGVRVNAVLPSIVDTPANRAEMGMADVSKWVRTEELAAVVAFLLSEGASAITGACIPVTGRV
jgi:NAD(P)-dependent dehydrogenase (short-subunit alcohol dehydrogenase family)